MYENDQAWETKMAKPGKQKWTRLGNKMAAHAKGAAYSTKMELFYLLPVCLAYIYGGKLVFDTDVH
jgi:hypothetical protein